MAIKKPAIKAGFVPQAGTIPFFETLTIIEF